MVSSIAMGGMIKEWPEQGISLYRDAVNADHFSVETLRESVRERRTITASPLDVATAISIINIFENVIAERVRRYDAFQRDTYLPRLYTDAMRYQQGNWEQLPHLKVVLFGQNDWRSGRGYDLAWYIFHEIEQRIVFESQEPSDLDNEFFGIPNLEERLKFRAVANVNTIGEIVRVGMRHCSHIDRNVLISEADWTVTLICITVRESCRSVGMIFQNSVGHAAVLYEGIDHAQGGYIKKYIHFTNKPDSENRHPDLQTDEAQIEIRDMGLSPTTFGPTWIRPRELVERMVEYAGSLRLRRIKFAAIGGQLYVHRTFSSWMKGDLPNPDWALYELPHTCLEWAGFLLKVSGVFLLNITPLTRPLKKVRELKEGNFYQIPRCFPHIIPGITTAGRVDMESEEYRQYSELRRNAKKVAAVIAPGNWNQTKISLAESMIFETSLDGLFKLHQAAAGRV